MRDLNKLLHPSIVREYFSYNPVSGELRWKKLDHLVRNAKVGDIAGCVVSKEDGRVTIGFKKLLIRAHIIIWAYMTGEWPAHRIDHKNEDPSDNRWHNLRKATQAENMRNISKPRKSNVSGYKGITANGSGWYARIKVDGKQKYLGTFRTKEEAHAAYVRASKELHGAFSPHF